MAVFLYYGSVSRYSFSVVLQNICTVWRYSNLCSITVQFYIVNLYRLAEQIPLSWRLNLVHAHGLWFAVDLDNQAVFQPAQIDRDDAVTH